MHADQKEEGNQTFYGLVAECVFDFTKKNPIMQAILNQEEEIVDAIYKYAFYT